MKITKKQLKRIIKEEQEKLLSEMNPDGTISDDEDEAIQDLLMHVEIQIDELIEYIKTQAYEIGGPYRGPGIKKEALRLLADKTHRAR